MISNQIVSESEKTQKWAEDNVRSIIRMANTVGMAHTRDKLCYDLYYGMQNESDYEYLTGSDEYRMPARVRFFPVAKPYFDLLLSTCEMRELKPSVFSIDTNSLANKKDELARELVDRILTRVDESQERVDLLRLQLDLFGQRAAQQAEAEGADPQAQVALRQMEIKISSIQKSIARGEDIIKAETEDLERARRFNFQTSQEINMTHGMRFLIEKYGMKRVFDKCFEDLMIVDQQIVKIEDVCLGKDPSIRRINPMLFYYGASLDATWIDEAPWTVEKRFMSVSQVLDEYINDLSDTQRSELKKRYNFGYTTTGVESYDWASTNQFNAMPLGGSDSCETGGDVYSGSALYTSDMVEVYVVCWKSVRRLKIKKTKSKYDDDLYHTHIVKDEERVKKTDEIEYRYVTDWWTGTMIGSSIFVQCRKIGFQHRDIEQIGKSYGPYVGWAYNGVDRRPYSTVWATKDLSILYNLVMYQKELLIALSGIRGVIMDKSQIPDKMETEEWFYNFKQGVGWIDSQRVGPGGRVGSNFNQFQTYDLSFGQALQQLDMTLQRIEHLLGRVIGIPPQRLGEITSNDQVGTQKQAIAQSNLTTETKFIKHEAWESRVLNRLANAATHAWKEGKRGQYVFGGMQQVFSLRAKDLDEAKYEVFFDRSGKVEQVMDRALSAMENSFAKGQLPLSQLMRAYRVENLNELEATISHYEDIARKIANQQMDRQSINEKERLEMEAQMKALVKKQLTDGEALKGQLEEARIQLEQAKVQAEIGVKADGVEKVAEEKRHDTNTNRAIEFAFLQESKRKTDIESRLRLLELEMQENSNRNPISSPPAKNKPSNR